MIGSILGILVVILMLDKAFCVTAYILDNLDNYIPEGIA